MFIDSHAHLEMFEDLDEVLARAKEVGVSKIITIGTSLETSKRAIQIAENFSNSDVEIYATCGIHPNDGAEEVENLGLGKVMTKLEEIVKSSKKVVGIGECGLDYFLESSSQRSFEKPHGKTETGGEEKGFQRKLFKAQIKLASDLNLPLVVHCRNAWNEIFEPLTISHKPLTNLRVVFHSFTGGVDEVKKAIDLGFYVSFSGIVTFKNAKNIQDAFKKVSTDRFLVETDSPFLAPEPLRGSQNEPKNVRILSRFLAEQLNLTIGRIEELTTNNTDSLFGFN